MATTKAIAAALDAPDAATADAVLAALGSDRRNGLPEGEARRRLDHDGPNVVPEQPPVPVIVLLARQFIDSMVLLLLGAAVISFAIGEGLDGAIILAIVVLNGVFGAVQEGRAQQAARAVRALLEQRTVVVRGGRPREIETAGLVLGDVVVLGSGDRVPADGRIVAAAGVEIDESVLTGEALPSVKRADPPPLAGAGLSDRLTMAYAGTLVSRGRARIVVTATGPRTEVAEIAELAGQERPLTPLQRQLDGLARSLLWAGAGICAALTIVFLIRGNALGPSLLLGVSLAVAAIPEGLTAVVTITLAVGMRRLAARGAIVRRLIAVETLGSTSVICTDKTGTLTRNEMTVTRLKSATKDDPAAVLEGALLASDPTMPGAEDAAIAAAIAELGLPAAALRASRELIAHVPFEAERRRASSVVREAGGQVLYVKGAPDVLLPRLIDTDVAARLGAVVGDWAAEGVRVLLVARRAEADGPEPREDELEALGVLGLSDPPRETARGAVVEAERAGVRTVMVTGDEPRTAIAVAHACGIGGAEPGVLTGLSMDQLTDDELTARIAEVDIFARIAPAQKLRIVRALQASGEVVAMTGDGVNDAPALAAANVGVAMGRGSTDAAMDAADIVITDNDLSTIVAAIGEGRAIYSNIVRFVRFLLSANAGEVLTFALAVLTGAAAPLTVPQILTVNLLTDGAPAVALGMDPADASVMRMAPRPPHQGLLDGARGLLALAATLTGVAAFTAFLIGTGTTTATGQTMAFTTLVLAQLAYVYAVRTDGPCWRGPANRLLALSVVGSTLFTFAALAISPLQDALDLVPLSASQVLASCGLALLPLLGAEIAKAIQRRSPGM